MEVIWSNCLAQAGPVTQDHVQTAFYHSQGWRQICGAFETELTLIHSLPYHEFLLDLADVRFLIVNFPGIKIDAIDTASRMQKIVVGFLGSSGLVVFLSLDQIYSLSHSSFHLPLVFLKKEKKITDLCG